MVVDTSAYGAGAERGAGDADISHIGSPAMGERLMTPSKITAWLDCDHYLTLQHEVESGVRPKPDQPFGSFAQLLMDKGLAHEAAVLAALEGGGRRVHRVDARGEAETFAQWAERMRPLLDDTDIDVLYQMPFVHDRVRGVADFLERRAHEDGGPASWEPIDAKLARSAAKPGHVLQLCFYAEAVAALTGVAPGELAVSLGSGDTERVDYEAVRPYWARLKSQLSRVLAIEPSDADTQPERCDHCQFCEFQATCDESLRSQDSLTFVAGIRRAEKAALEAGGVPTLTSLATAAHAVDGVRPERLDRLRAQAALQLQAREAPDDPPPFVEIPSGDDPVWGHGFDTLPQPDPADVFLDFEGHPFWRPDQGLFFLFGHITTATDGTWTYTARWAHDDTEERQRVQDLVRFLHDRWQQHPGMHVYHYNHTERSALESLASRYAVAEFELGAMVDAKVFVDLLPIVRNAVQVGVESYGLKHVERLTPYERSHDIDKGAGAVVAFERYATDGDTTHLAAIEAYNDDDVRATLALRDWLIDHRPAGLPWPVTEVDQPDEPAETDELLEQLSAFPDGSVEHLLADLLGYWRREWRAYIAPIVGKLTADEPAQLDEPSVLAGLADPEEVPLLTATGRAAKWPGLRFTFPPQALDRAFTDGGPKKVIHLTGDGSTTFSEVSALDVDAGTITLKWNGTAQERGTVPTAVVADEWYKPGAKWDALVQLARQVLDPAEAGEPNRVTMALLRGDRPAFRPGGGPAGAFHDDPADLARWATELDHAVLPVQGPPGTGKTFRGAHMVKALVRSGKRVGIMAMSHHAIDNFLAKIVEVFADDPATELRAIRKHETPEDGGLPGVTYTGDNSALADPDFDVVAATAWSFASKSMLAAPVDVLLIDEAGQLALIDAVVGSMAAESVVLLGDPLQLAQVAQATHPGGSGASALGHLLGDDETMPDDRGVFIEETRRMHPDVCRFISDRIYQGRLISHPDCARQDTALGTGLRWLRVVHDGCATESEEETEAVAGLIGTLLGQPWTDQRGAARRLTAEDILVVAPYNDQVRALRRRLGSDRAMRGVQVGTVDKFQGREAPVVVFSMTSSSADDMPRGAEFLFSRNRLNVAVSRAQCLAYLVCTEELLDSRAQTVEDMHLIATLCAFVEYAEPL